MGVRRSIGRWLGLAAACGLAGPALGQLRPHQVLVVYDSRVPDSADVARLYAGSARVPGGSTFEPGFRPGVQVFDLATATAAALPAGNVSYPNFVAGLRTPIRDAILARAGSDQIRCVVLTKGLPHRLLDTDAGDVGDFVSSFVNEVSANDMTGASVDSELVLLWQDLSANEQGRASDSLADGLILNPYWRETRPISSYTPASNRTTKLFQATGSGPTWITSASVGSASRLTPGDLVLVSRLDAPTVADVRAMLQRSARITTNLATATVLLDEGPSNGVADPCGNGELDAANGSFASLCDGDDYERTRDELLADLRFAAPRVRYDPNQGIANFFIGPRIPFENQGSILITSPVILLATLGSNHLGVPSLAGGGDARRVYADSYNYAPGAIFNTIESFNGRAFGPLTDSGPSAAQYQASRFIAQGGSFAIGHVWEPLADTIADNRLLAANFIRGDLSWVEAAWSSIPALSWMHIVIGDPLARMGRSTEDINADGRVDAQDLYAWEALSPTAPAKDINRDGVANTADRAVLINWIRAWERSDVLGPRR